MNANAFRLSALAVAVALPGVAVAASSGKVVVAYQTGPDPVEVAFASGVLARRPVAT